MEKKPFYKKWWGILIIVVLVIGIIGALTEDKENLKENENMPEDVANNEQEENNLENEENKDGNMEENAETEEGKENDDSNEAGNDAGDKEDGFVLDKEFKRNFGKARKVRNDLTGNWRLVTTAAKFDVEEMLIAYHDHFMKEGEIHFIVSFATNTTTVIRNSGGIITSEVHEYVDKEEHDAKTLGSGMILAEYMVVDGVVEQINTD